MIEYTVTYRVDENRTARYVCRAKDLAEAIAKTFDFIGRDVEVLKAVAAK